ncbi:MAG: prenyltransferase [Proteobacteria bacterium]|nr:MAG: prenyltransferase [Pseudomonadota bacterium]
MGNENRMIVGKERWENIQSSEAREILWSGQCKESGDAYHAIAEQVVRDQVQFRLVPADELQRPMSLVRYFSALRAISLTATFSPGVLVALAGWLQNRPFNAWLFTLASLGAVLFQVAVNTWNDVEDHLKLIDLPGGIGGSGVIQKGWLTAREVRRLGNIALVLGILCGLPVVWINPKLMIVIAVIALIGTWGYSGWPFRFKYRAVGDITVGILCGPALTIGYAIASFGSVQVTDWFIGIVTGILAVGILHANNLHDIETDQSRGGKTWASVMGFKSSIRMLGFLYGFAMLAELWIANQLKGLVFGAVLISSLLLAKFWSKVRHASGPWDPRIRLIRFEAAQLHLMCCVILAISFVLQTWIRNG